MIGSRSSGTGVVFLVLACLIFPPCLSFLIAAQNTAEIKFVPVYQVDTEALKSIPGGPARSSDATSTTHSSTAFGDSHQFSEGYPFFGFVFTSPQAFLASLTGSNIKAAELVSLLRWKKFAQQEDPMLEPYHRMTHFGGWIKESGDCRNTRALVLSRDSQRPVEFKKNSVCTVLSGEWVDPYTSTLETNPKKLQIDHLVPLKNAYLSGARTWSDEERCWFANNSLQRGLLLVTSAHENMTKGHSGPDAYLPPNSDFVCSYLHHWLEVKATWNLIMSETEAIAIATAFKDYKCTPSDFWIESQMFDSLVKIRGKIPQACKKSNKPTGP